MNLIQKMILFPTIFNQLSLNPVETIFRMNGQLIIFSLRSALAYFIHRNRFLAAAFKTGDPGISFQGMFLTDTAIHSFSP